MAGFVECPRRRCLFLSRGFPAVLLREPSGTAAPLLPSSDSNLGSAAGPGKPAKNRDNSNSAVPQPALSLAGVRVTVLCWPFGHCFGIKGLEVLLRNIGKSNLKYFKSSSNSIRHNAD